MAQVLRPRWCLKLEVPIEAIKHDIGDTNVVIMDSIPCSRFCLVRNDHNQCDTLDVTVGWNYAGVDPRLLQSAIGTFYLGEASPDGTWNPTDDDIRFAGVCVKPKRISNVGSAMHVELVFHDYTAFFLACKNYNEKDIIPEYSDTLSSAWRRICLNTGRIDPDDPGAILPTTARLANNIDFLGDAKDVTIGTAVAERYRKFGKVQPPLKCDSWAIWRTCTEMLGLISFMREDRCIVTTATDYYSALSPGTFILGQNVKSFNDERDLSICGKGITIRSFNSLTGTVIEGFYPPIGDPTVKHKKVSAKHRTTDKVIASEDREVYDVPGCCNQESVDLQARKAYEEFSRQEYSGRLTTGDRTVPSANGSFDVDLFGLYDGDAIGVIVDKLDLEALGQRPSQNDKIAYLVARRGYAQRLAEIVVKNIDYLVSLPTVYLTKRVQIEGDTTAEGGNLQVEIDFCNKILIDGGTESPPAAKATAKTYKPAGKNSKPQPKNTTRGQPKSVPVVLPWLPKPE